MKKLIIISIMLLALVPAAFAADGQIGISLTPQWFWISKVMDYDIPGNLGTTSFLLTVDGANYFGEDGGFGIEYGLGASFPLNVWGGNYTESISSSATSLAFRFGLGYRYQFSSLIGVIAGLGVNGDAEFNRNGNASTTSLMLGLYGRVGVDFTLLDFLRINAGIAVGGPVYLAAFGSGSSASVGIGGFYLAPSIGVAYTY